MAQAEDDTRVVIRPALFPRPCRQFARNETWNEIARLEALDTERMVELTRYQVFKLGTIADFLSEEL